MRYHIFEFSEADAPYFVPAIDLIDYPWQDLVPGLMRQVGRDYIPLRIRDLSRFGGSDAVTSHSHARGHGSALPPVGAVDKAHPLERPVPGDDARLAVLGLYWLSVAIDIEQSLRSDPEMFAAILAYEVAHAVDYAVLDDPTRVAIGVALHPGGPDSHTWWEILDYNGEYRFLLGETFMELFARVYARLPERVHHTLHHEITEAAKMVVLAFLTPDRVPPAPVPRKPKRRRRWGWWRDLSDWWSRGPSTI